MTKSNYLAQCSNYCSFIVGLEDREHHFQKNKSKWKNKVNNSLELRNDKNAQMYP